MSTRTPSEIARALRQTAAILRRPGTADAEAQKEPVFRHGRAELLDEAARVLEAPDIAVALDRVVSTQPDYRTTGFKLGMPSYAAVKAHEWRGGWWQMRCGDSISSLRMGARTTIVLISPDGNTQPFETDDESAEFRPVLLEFSPAPWP